MNINKIFFEIKNTKCEIYLMWFILVITIFILICLLFSDSHDWYETKRIIDMQ